MLRKWYHKLFEKKKIQPIRLRPRVRLRLEALEDRVVPATFLVTSTADDGSAGTLRAAIAQANASSDATNTISFSLPSGPQKIVLTQGALALNNSHSTTILGTGADQLFISGNYASGVFSIGSGATVELDNLTIEDGSSITGGGIYNAGNLTINNSILTGNTASNIPVGGPASGCGGGLYDTYYATATINNSTISNNTAAVSGGGICNGGLSTAYPIYDATLTINNSTISNNTAASSGGGILNYGSSTATINNSTLADNSASFGGGILNYGGASYYGNGYSTATISNSTFSGNMATYGGGIYSSLGNLRINTSTLTGNTAKSVSFFDGDGGGIYNADTATISNCTLSGNTAARYGGGIDNGGGTTTIGNCTFTSNTAQYGGGIYGPATISNCTLANNTATRYGGGIYNGGSGTATISNCILAGNMAQYGGGIWNAGTATLSNCTLASNTATSSGGGIYHSGFLFNGQYGTLSINNCTLAGNAASSGGGIYNGSGTATINNSTLAGNEASSGGGIFNYGDVTTIIRNSTLAGNSASSGGGIYNIGFPTAMLGNSIVAANTAGSASDVRGSFTSLGHNLIGIADGSSGFSNGVNGDLVGSAASPLDPKLGPLANNGGPTQTMALLVGSPAIDAGSNALIPIDPSTGQPTTTDQRGSGYARIVGSSVDIGAYELQQQLQTITFNPLPNRTYGDADFALTATASSGLPVSYSASGNVTLYQDTSGNWFAHITGAGTATITASQAGNSAYLAAPDVSQTFSIAQATPAVSVTDAGGIYDGQPFPAMATVAGVIAGVDNTPAAILQGVALTLSYYAGSSANGTALAGAPTQAGTYTVVASFAGSTDYTAASASATFTIAQATTTFSNLTVQQITLGTSTTTVSGQLTSNTIVPVGQSVSITLNGVTQSTTLGADGSFSVSFDTSALGVGAYTISYSFAGDNNFTAASATGRLTVDYGSQLLFNNSKPVHAGAVLPVKVELTDASGADISSPNIAVTATSLVDSNGNAVPLNPAGNANPNDLFRYDPNLGGYIFNLDTKGLTAGTYTLYYTAGNDPTLHSLTFVVA